MNAEQAHETVDQVFMNPSMGWQDEEWLLATADDQEIAAMAWSVLARDNHRSIRAGRECGDVTPGRAANIELLRRFADIVKNRPARQPTHRDRATSAGGGPRRPGGRQPGEDTDGRGHV